MGRKRVPSPRKLSGKLREVRIDLLRKTMDEMAKELKNSGAEVSTHSGYVSEYETGKRQPSLLTLLAYSKVTGLSINVFVDDDLELPQKLPNPEKHSTSHPKTLFKVMRAQAI
jgi:transcriptional regulator with XRE-family HTH domain